MKTLNFISWVCISLLCAFMCDCTVQKRKYRDGFYVSTKKASVRNTNISSARGEKLRQAGSFARQDQDVQVPVRQVMGLTASALTVGGCPKHTPDIRPLPPTIDNCGDRLIFQDGEEKAVKVFEISSKKVSYKPCDYLDGPMYTCSKEKLFMITYSNGSTEVIKPGENSEYGANKPYAPAKVAEAKKVNNVAKSGFIFALLSWTIILAPVAFILGLIGMVQINNNPEKYTGRGFALAAILIPVCLMAILFLI